MHFVCAFADQLMGYKGGLRCMQMCESSFPCAAIVGSSFWKSKLCFPYCEVSYMKQAFLKFRTSVVFEWGKIGYQFSIITSESKPVRYIL